MQPHPYVRAYLAGIAVPTCFLLVIILPVYVYFRFYFEVPSQFVTGLPGPPLERAIVFPMAVVPNAWGIWNMLHLALRADWCKSGVLLAPGRASDRAHRAGRDNDSRGRAKAPQRFSRSCQRLGPGHASPPKAVMPFNVD